MRLGHGKRTETLTPELKSKLFKLGMLLFLAGLFVLSASFQAIPFIKVPLEYLDITFTVSFLMIPAGAIMMMVGRVYYRIGYIAGLLVFLAAVGMVAHFQMQSYRVTNVDRCCEMFVEGGSCTHEEFPENFSVTIEENEVDCRLFPAGNNVHNWRSVCNC